MGVRAGVLRRLIEIYKYQSVRAACYELADLMSETIDGDYTIVPLPTIRKHIRERGFDHIGLIAQKMPYAVEKALFRRNNSVQVGADSELRHRQASVAYGVKNIAPERRYLLLDDVWTTGSTMMATCELMRSAGAKNLAIAVIARS